MEALETYRKLIREYADAGPTTVEGLSNLLPMALAALALDGAPAEALDRFARRYASRLEPRRPHRAMRLHGAQAAWDCRAQPARYWDAEAFFRAAVETDGIDGTLQTWLPRLMPGMAAAAFHGLIRTAYAVRMQAGQEVAAGLATWLTGFFAMPLPRGLPLALDAQLQRMERAPALQSVHWSRPPIMPRLREVAGHAVFNDLLQPLPAGGFDAALQSLAGRAVRRYAERLDPTILHLVTSAHALTMLQPRLPDPHAALQVWWPAYAVAWVGAEAGEAEGVPEAADAELDWATIRARAHASDDDHVVKMSFSCMELAARWSDEAYRLAASRLVRRGAQPG